MEFPHTEGKNRLLNSFFSLFKSFCLLSLFRYFQPPMSKRCKLKLLMAMRWAMICSSPPIRTAIESAMMMV